MAGPLSPPPRPSPVEGEGGKPTATVSASTQTLTFGSHANSGGDATFLLDNVRINDVPEPASLLLLDCGLAGLALRRCSGLAAMSRRKG
jgi:hypothetical protein